MTSRRYDRDRLEAMELYDEGVAARHLVRADAILDALSKRHVDDLFLAEVKTGRTAYAVPGELHRIDALAVKRSWAKPEFVAYEVKVSRSDFLLDTKWPAYRDYCHRLYFACPSGLIKPAETADDVGLVYYNPENGALSTAKKAVFRDIGFPTVEMVYYILISRVGSDHHPFFSTRRQELEAWLRDKELRKRLGEHVGGRLVKERDECATRTIKAENERDHWRKRFEGLKGQLEFLGFKLEWDDRLPWDLRKLLERALPPDLLGTAQQIESTTRKLIDRLVLLGNRRPPPEPGQTQTPGTEASSQ